MCRMGTKISLEFWKVLVNGNVKKKQKNSLDYHLRTQNGFIGYKYTEYVELKFISSFGNLNALFTNMTKNYKRVNF